MLAAEIKIDKSLDIVWDYYINPKNWSKWHGAVLQKVSPGWKEGAELLWGNGQTSQIRTIAPKKEVQIKGTFLIERYYFKTIDKRSTLFGIESIPTGGAYFRDGGLAEKKQLESDVKKFKEQVELPNWKFW